MSPTEEECPELCKRFECIRTPDSCTQECDHSPLCMICKNAPTCDPLRKRVYVEKKIKSEAKAQDGAVIINPITLSGNKVQELLVDHRYHEMRLEELRKEYHVVSWLNFPKKAGILKEGNITKLKIKFSREFMKKIGIKYKATVSVDNE